MEDRDSNNPRKKKNKVDSTPTTISTRSKRIKIEEESPRDSSNKPSKKRSLAAATIQIQKPSKKGKYREKGDLLQEETMASSKTKTPEDPEQKETQQISSSEPQTPPKQAKSNEVLQGLLSKLESPNESFIPNPSIGRSRLNTLLQGLKSEDEAQQLQSLMELCDFLSIGTEDNMAHFSVDAFVPALVNLLNLEHNPDMMLLTCRALTYLIEALPSSCASIVANEAIPLLCAKLLAIEYIDLAEQALQCLEKISYEHPTAILQAGGLMAVLSFLDFFPIETQRTCLSICSNTCRQVPAESFSFVADAIPILANLLQYQDQKIVEKAIICFARLAESFYAQEDKLQIFVKNDVHSHLVRLISLPTISQPMQILVIRLLTTLCSCCPSLTASLLENAISSLLQGLLVGTSTSTDVMSSTTTTPVNGEQLHEILSLASELLPSLPKDIGTFFSGGRTIPTPLRGELRKAPVKHPKQFGHKKKDGNEEEAKEETEEDPREKILIDHPHYLVNFAECLLLPLLQVYNAAVNPSVRYKCLMAITKVLHFATADMLTDLLRDLSISSFTANLLASTDMSTVAIALKICEILITKLPKIFYNTFKREGVFNEIDKLANEKLKKSTSTDMEVHTWVVDKAVQFKQTYMHQDNTNSSEELNHLKQLCEKLKHSLGQPNADLEAEQQLWSSICNMLTEGKGISTFEFIGSGFMDTLLDYLVTQPGMQTRRAAVFCRVFMNIDTNASQPLRLLVSKLEDVINKEEKFPVLLNEIPGTASGLKYLTQPFKLKLQGDKNAKLADYSENVVLIEPLATVNAILEFLLPRVFNKNQSPKSPTKAELPMEEHEESEESENSQEPVHDVKLSGNATESEPAEREKEPQESSGQLQLMYEGEVLPRDATIFQVIQKATRKEVSEGVPPFPVQKMWETVHTIQYTVCPASPTEPAHTPSHVRGLKVLDSPYIRWLNQIPEISSHTSDFVRKALSILFVLSKLNWVWPLITQTKVANPRPIISPVEFVNSKLTAKLMRQLQDPLTLCSGALPDWCKELTSVLPVLFPFESRRFYFSCTSYGIARALQSLQQYIAGTENSSRSSEFKVGRIQRQKVRISRSKVLESAVKVMELYGKSKAILEVEYFGEVGTGLGPTLEFYTMVSRELQKRKYKLWRDTSKSSSDPDELVSATSLFPAPVPPGEEGNAKMFKFIGCFVAKSMLDNRLLDLPLSVPFLKWMIGEELSLHDLASVDPDYVASLEKLVAVCEQKQTIEQDASLSEEQKTKKIKALQIGGVSIEDLDLDFTLPGNPNWELKPGGSKIGVNIFNLEEYLNLIVEQNLTTGVESSLKAFREGFNQVFPMDNLRIFSVEELELLICGSEQGYWEMSTLIDNTRCEHGYTHSSPTVKYLLEVMTEFTPTEQRQFLLFVTGSPKLPLGGFKSLDPKLTIVRKDAGQLDPDSYLPSVNCCFYYLKLPEYSSKKVLQEKIKFAIDHGQGSFSFN